MNPRKADAFLRILSSGSASLAAFSPQEEGKKVGNA
jgi:hypothetical protein